MHVLKNRTDTLNNEIEECQKSVVFEHGIIDSLVKLFTEIRHGLPSDASHVNKLVDLQLNKKRELITNVVFEGFNLAQKRCILMLKKVCLIENPVIPKHIMDMAFFVIGVKSETFEYFTDKVKFVAGLSDLGELEETLKHTPNVLIHKSKEFQSMIEPSKILRVENLTKSVSPLLRHNDIFVLILLNFLLMHQDNHEDWFRSVKRLLFKRIKDLCVLEGLQDVQSIYDNFCQEICELARLQCRVVASKSN